MTAPAIPQGTVRWLSQHEACAVAEFRACELCAHSTPPPPPELGLLCSCPIVAGTERTKPVAAARARHGGCGPDALHMHMQGVTS